MPPRSIPHAMAACFLSGWTAAEIAAHFGYDKTPAGVRVMARRLLPKVSAMARQRPELRALTPSQRAEIAALREIMRGDRT